MTTLILLVLIAVAITFAAAFFYVSKILSLPPQGRAIDYINSKSKKIKELLLVLVIP